MSRDLSTALVTEVTAPALRPVLLAEFLFDGGAVRLWSGIGDLIAMGNTYTGAGNLLSIDEYVETQKLEAVGLKMTLSGISSSLIAIALAEPYQGRECNIYFGALNSSGVLVSDPYRQFSGQMDVMEINDQGDTCTIQLAAESKLIITSRTKERRYTAEDQKSEYLGDLGFDFVNSLQDADVVWQSKR